MLQKCTFSLLAICFFSAFAFSQDSSAFNWKVSSSRISDKSYELHFTTQIKNGWQLYAPDQMISEVPASELIFSDSSITIEKPFQSKGKKTVYNNKAFGNARFEVYNDSAVFIFLIHFSKTPPAQLIGTMSYTYGKEMEFYPLNEFQFSVPLEGGQVSTSRIKIGSIDMDHPVNSCGGTGAEGSKSLWTIFILGIIGGLLGLIMPCTFPMIPLTVSFFTKQSGDKSKGIRNASMYGFFIFLIYVLISVPFYFLGANSSDILNNISTNAWLNILFAVVFFVFALSFFGLFELTLPGNVMNRVDSKSNLKSMGGIFFMALTLAVVSFSCTGPILGTLLVGALNDDGGALQLTVAMAGFGLALGLPFALFAMFPGWLSKLPRSGAWMNTVKIVFAFVELALMVKFLSNADLVMHWGLLKREVFFAIWILIGLATTLYLFGIVRFHGEARPKLSPVRIFFGLAFFAFTVYLIPGLSNTSAANRSLISGFPPPLNYSVYGHDQSKGKGVEPVVINDYEKALSISQSQHKPLLLDFTGWACVNCRKMEENVWVNEEVKELLQNKFVLLSLYVDDRKVLPSAEQEIYITKDGSKKRIETIGDKYATFQSENFRNASQPLYVVLSNDEELLTLPVGYTPDAKKFADWLRCGLKAYSEQK